MQWLRVKDWETFQHYKDRAPPWIKLHKSLLDNFDFHRLPLASRALSPCIWLLASEFKFPQLGLIEYDVEMLSFRLRCGQDEITTAINGLVDKKFLEILDDIEPLLASCYQVAMPEERRGEKRQSRVERAKRKNDGTKSKSELANEAVQRGLADLNAQAGG